MNEWINQQQKWNTRIQKLEKRHQSVSISELDAHTDAQPGEEDAEKDRDWTPSGLRDSISGNHAKHRQKSWRKQNKSRRKRINLTPPHPPLLYQRGRYRRRHWCRRRCGNTTTKIASTTPPNSQWKSLQNRLSPCLETSAPNKQSTTLSVSPSVAWPHLEKPPRTEQSKAAAWTSKAVRGSQKLYKNNGLAR